MACLVKIQIARRSDLSFNLSLETINLFHPMCVEVVITNFLAATGQSAGLYKSLPNRGRSSENNSNGKQIDI